MGKDSTIETAGADSDKHYETDRAWEMGTINGEERDLITHTVGDEDFSHVIEGPHLTEIPAHATPDNARIPTPEQEAEIDRIAKQSNYHAAWYRVMGE